MATAKNQNLQLIFYDHVILGKSTETNVDAIYYINVKVTQQQLHKYTNKK